MNTEVIERVTPQLHGNADTLLMAITQAAANPAVDIDKMERLFTMHREMVAREAEAEFNRALALTQKKIEPVAARAWNSHTKSYYAKLDAINSVIIPIYTEQGFSLSFNTKAHADKGWIKTEAILSHRAGHSRMYELDMPLDESGSQGTKNKTGVQATGSTVQYSRRYLSCMIFNVSTYNDTDGNRQDGEDGPEPDAVGKGALEAAASIDSLKAVWQGLSKEQRATLGGVMSECRRRINQADAS